MAETFEQQSKDSDMIFTQVIHGNFNSFEEVELLIVRLYVPDMSISRAGISHVLQRLKKHFNQKSVG